jgi:CRP-like cAMP-binding protein
LTFFSGLPSSDAFIKDITGLMKLRPFKAGDTVIHYGDEAKCMYLIVKGELGIISEDNEIEYATLTAGSFVGEIGVLFNSRRSATVVCKTKSLLVSLTSEDIHSKLEQYPEIKEHLHLTGTERLQAIENTKNNNLVRNDDSGSDGKRGKAGFNVARSTSFRSFSPDSSFNSGQNGGLSPTKNKTMGLLTPDSMVRLLFIKPRT